MTKPIATPDRPANCNNNFINLAGTIAAIFAVLYFRENKIYPISMALWVAGIYVAVIAALEVIFLRTPWRESAGFDFSRWKPSAERIAVKIIGLYSTISFIAFLYWLFPEYHGDFYKPFFIAMTMIGPALAIIAIPYVIFTDGFSKEPTDSYYHFGKWVMLDGRGISRNIIVQHLLGWIVKGFFLPMMLISFSGNLVNLTNADFTTYFLDINLFVRHTLTILFTLDLLVAVGGYMFTLRLFDSHIRSSEPTLFGWFVCLMCYQPFLSVFMRLYLPYSNNSWLPWLEDSPELRLVWAAIAFGGLTVYTITSLNFGLRFSNLTHRGVLTTGMYRFTKHPAYVGKNLFWWMTYIPFIPVNGGMEAFRYTLLMVGISGVYYLRARTEEAHLSRDPIYVKYALHMNEHSIFRVLTPFLPFLRYKAPADWQNLPPYKGIK